MNSKLDPAGAGSFGEAVTDPFVEWDTERDPTFAIALPPAEDESQFLALPIHASRKSMLFVGIVAIDDNGDAVYETTMVVEWAGLEPIYLLMPQEARLRVRTLAFTAADATFAGTVLAIGTPVWLRQRPLVPVNAGECLLDMFTNGGYYHVDMWQREESGEVSAAVAELRREWNYAALKLTVPYGGSAGAAAYSREYDHDIGAFQAFIACVSVEPSARFSLQAVIDGEDKLLIDNRPGAGMEEIRVPIGGSRIERITVRLAVEGAGDHVAHLYWFMLERRGADPRQSNEVAGMDDIADPPLPESAKTPALALKLLLGDEELKRLRGKTASGRGRRFYEEVIAEAEANLPYRPESYVGTYFPVYWANQGIERASSPYERTRQWFSTLVYSSLAYVLSGERKYGCSARRALLAAIRCDEWCGGFVCRIPRGIAGYRAPFTESHLMQAVALCYDFVGDLLSDEEKRAVEDAVYDKAIPALDMYLRKHSEGYLLESNQGAVYSLGIHYACLVARRSHPDVDAILERQTAWFLRMLANYYKADGTTGEGMTYWEYTTHYAVECLLLIARHTNRDVVDIAPPQLKDSMRYVLHMRSLNDDSLSFLPIGDSRTDRYKYMGPSLLFFANCYGDTAAHWMWHRYYGAPNRPGSSFFGDERSTGQYTSNGLLTLLLHEERPVEEPSLPDSYRFGCDRVFWRTGPKESDLLLFFEGGAQTFEHTHYDKGQFIIQAYGEFVAADPGMIDYSKPEHVHYPQSAYHNIVTLRGANQSYKNAKQAVLLRACEHDDQFHHLQADLANSYKELDRYERTIVFVKPHYFVVLDEVVAPAGGIEWNFHSRCELRAAGDNRWIAEGTKAGFVMQVASDAKLAQRTSRYTDEGTVVSHNLVLHPDSAAATLHIAALLVTYPLAEGPAPVEVKSEPVPGGVSFAVAGPWGRDTVLVRLGEHPVVRNGAPVAERIHVERQGDVRLERSFG